MTFHHTTLPNGLTVLAELDGDAHSVAAGYFVNTGSRDEAPDVGGVSHFLEHMAFKGDDEFSAEDVNRIFDDIGARYNAYTSQEQTLYYAAVLPESLPTCMHLLTTLVRPALREEEFELEKQVILEEIGMHEDQPGSVAYDALLAAHFAGHPLAGTILGPRDVIASLSVGRMREYHAARYAGGNLTLVVTGRTDWDAVQRLADEFAAKIPAGPGGRDHAVPAPAGGTTVVTKGGNALETLMLAAPAPPADSPLRAAADLLAAVVGDDVGSRLFWELVDPGKAEGCELSYNEMDGCGMYLTYLSCDPGRVADNLAAVRDVFDRVNTRGVTSEELTRAVSKAAGRTVLQSERPMGRLGVVGGDWIYRGEHRTVDEELDALRSLTVHDLRDLLAQYPLTITTTAAVGPLEAL